MDGARGDGGFSYRLQRAATATGKLPIFIIVFEHGQKRRFVAVVPSPTPPDTNKHSYPARATRGHASVSFARHEWLSMAAPPGCPLKLMVAGRHRDYRASGVPDIEEASLEALYSYHPDHGFGRHRPG